MINQNPLSCRPIIGWWLILCSGLIFIMIVIGGLTRLTDSGLSITTWDPIMGAIPPFSHEEWQDRFTLYQQTPEYQKINQGMTLGEFKAIFWWEYAHRLLGRLLGLVYFIPFIFFILKGNLRGRLLWHTGAIFFLGGMQGAVGWWMVQSGLVDRPDVSHYRLAIHLLLAFGLHTYIWLLALRILKPVTTSAVSQPPLILLYLPALILIVILYGAFVAGLDAGMVYNSFPTMDGQWVPHELGHLQPWYADVTSNPVTVQWLHRWLATCVTFGIIALALFYRQQNSAWVFWLKVLAISVSIQFLLGIATLLSQVDICWAIVHQANGFVVYTISLVLAYEVYWKRRLSN